jgi:hypothetical protein
MTDQLSQQLPVEPTVEVPSVAKPVRDAHERATPGRGSHVPSRPIHAAAQELKHLEELERAGESEWTPWIAIAGLIVLFAAVGLLMFGIVEAASQLFLTFGPRSSS